MGDSSDSRERRDGRPLGEFDLIDRFFGRAARAGRTEGGAVALGIGDDCALLTPSAGHQWLVTADMLVEGRHFLSTVSPRRLGHKALAVNLSDLAACGATPRAFFLSLALPRVDEAFLAGFAQGLFELADAQGIVLAGGDTTAGPLNLNITAMGEVPAGQALLRSGARVDDDVWVSGTLGDARLALEVFRGTLSLSATQFEEVRLRMEMPEPRVALGKALRGLATSAVDVSDGLAGDIGHVLKRSNVGATLRLADLPRSAVLGAMPEELQRLCLLTGGDDYELVFTAPPDARQRVLEAGRAAGTPVYRIGRIDEAPGLRVVDGMGRPVQDVPQSFDHFKS
ncbi:thiamine-phosphate kinase [Roseateles chitinivorans]|uniref:Thiamine-monophosphate kinase n=1 Tax=Roseateles chitinivorans TaxID=2917965 RepID=A0A2G9CEB6_9BURK|nr:thiamine-phosphate kinase [Roseateles chitinivorans]PIM54763.1 thiamine-phosphate kinase [Roseateles chitinivorans]